MKFIVQRIEGGTVNSCPPEGFKKTMPVKFEGPISAIGPIGDGVELKVPVVEWNSGEVVMFTTEHRHDGTLLFTICAVSAVVSEAEAYAESNPGEWQMSHAFVGARDITATQMTETVFVTLKKK